MTTGIDWEGEIISSLAELRKGRRKNEHLKKQLLRYEETLNCYPKDAFRRCFGF